MSKKYYIFILSTLLSGFLTFPIPAGAQSADPPGPRLIINEVMVDPTPVRSLPDCEYIELFNNETITINTLGWSVDLNGRKKLLPDVAMLPGSYLLLTPAGGSIKMSGYGRVTELSGLSLANTGVTILLTDGLGNLSDRLTYSPGMQEKWAEQGGISLERIDPSRSCGESENWLSSSSPEGGTPGTRNSQLASNSDKSPPALKSCRLDDEKNLILTFTEKISDSFTIRCSDAGGITLLPDSTVSDAGRTILILCFNKLKILSGIKYEAIIENLSDECGNRSATITTHFGFYRPEAGDLLIAELLFNPHPYGVDFIELYNHSAHPIDLSSIRMQNTSAPAATKSYPCSLIPYLLLPGNSVALCRDAQVLRQSYAPPDSALIIGDTDLPDLPDESGIIQISTASGELLDRFNYNETMHSTFISDYNGVSLERDLTGPPGTASWYSSSGIYHYASPGYRPRKPPESKARGQEVLFTPQQFSPGVDGLNDYTTLTLPEKYSGWLLRLTLCNTAGGAICNPFSNTLTGRGTSLVWDGRDENGKQLPPGIYLYLLQLFSPQGKIVNFRNYLVITTN